MGEVAAGLEPPLIVVGHSMGGFVVATYIEQAQAIFQETTALRYVRVVQEGERKPSGDKPLPCSLVKTRSMRNDSVLSPGYTEADWVSIPERSPFSIL